MALTVGALQILLGVNLDRKSLAIAQGGLGGIGRMAMGLAGYFGARHLGKSMISFNENVENAKLNIASMLALANKTGVSEHLAVAGEQYDKIRKAAAELPGTTEEYVNAMSRLVFPLTKAGFSLDKIRELTVNTVVAAKGIGITSVAASIRDVQQALEGRFSSTDLFLKSLLEPMGYEGESGRKKFKALSKEKRAEVLNEALTQKAIVESAKLQAQTFSGQMDKVKEQTAQFLGKIGLPLFKALGGAIKRANEWLTQNSAAVQSVADSIGGALVTAFHGIGAAIGFLIDHEDATISVLLGIAGAMTFLAARATVAWIAAMGPFATLVAVVGGAVYLFIKLREHIGDVGAAAVAVAASLGALFMLGKLNGMIKGMRTLITLVRNYGTASLTSGRLAAIQGAINQRALAAGGMGPGTAMMQAGALAQPMGAATGKAYGSSGAKAAGTGAAGMGTAAKAGGGGVMAALGPVGWTILGAKLLSDATGGDFQDQATAKGIIGEDEGDLPFWEVMQRIHSARVNAPGGDATAANTNNITNGPTNIIINAANTEDALAQIAKIDEERTAAQLRGAKRATSGNRA